MKLNFSGMTGWVRFVWYKTLRYQYLPITTAAIVAKRVTIICHGNYCNIQINSQNI